MDTSVKPADDFFLYANGGWIKRTEIPPEYSRWGSFNQLIEQNNDALHAIAEKASKTKADPKTAPELQKVGDYYASGMDEKTIEAMRTKPLQDELQDRRDERSTRCAERNRASAHDRRERVLQFRLRPGRQGQHARDRAGGAGRARHAGPRLLHQDGRRFEKTARPICRSCDQDADAARRTGGEGRRRREENSRARNFAGAGVAHAGGAARSAKELQQDDAGRAASAHAGLELGRLLQGNRSHGAGRHRCASARFLQSGEHRLYIDIDGRLENVSALASHQRHGARAFERFRERRFQFQRNYVCAARNRSSRAGNASLFRPMARSAKRSANFTWPIIFRRKRRRARWSSSTI